MYLFPFYFHKFIYKGALQHIKNNTNFDKEI